MIPFKKIALIGAGNVAYNIAKVLKNNGVIPFCIYTRSASKIQEIQAYSFLTNSDAHSLPKIAREYQKLILQDATFLEFKKALRNEDGRAIKENYGLNPLLGKYYQTVCANCFNKVDSALIACPQCNSEVFIKN